MKKKERDFFIYIKDEEHWNSHINEDNKKLSGKNTMRMSRLNSFIVVDAYMSWSGPTELMFPTWKAITNATDEWENRLEFLLVSTVI